MRTIISTGHVNDTVEQRIRALENRAGQIPVTYSELTTLIS